MDQETTTLQETSPEKELPTPETSENLPEKTGESVSHGQLGTAALALALLLVLVTAIELAGVAPEASVAAAAQARAGAHAAEAFEHISLGAQSAYVINLTTGEEFFALNPDVQLPLASITKVALALAVTEVLPLEARITIPRDTAPPGSAERLAAGETWTVQDILDFTLVASSNGGAQILADTADEPLRVRYTSAPAGSAALWRMNDLARERGLSSMYFLNVHGLDESKTQAGAYGSARDVANLLAYAQATIPSVFENTARKDISLEGVGASTAAFNTNKALGDIPGLMMGKTGFTDLAGGNLAVVFEAGLSDTIAIVVLGSSYEGRFADVAALVDASLEELSYSAEGVE